MEERSASRLRRSTTWLAALAVVPASAGILAEWDGCG